MKRLLPVLLLLSAAVPAGCAATPATATVKARPNTLTPAETAGGWVLLFDGETPFGWQVDGEAKVTEGTLALGGRTDTTAMIEPGYAELSWDYRRDGDGEPELTVWAWEGGNWDSQGSAPLHFPATDDQRIWTSERWKVQPSPGAERGIRVSGGNLMFPATTRAPRETTFTVVPSRLIRIQLRVPAGTTLCLRNVRCRPLGLEPLFNGENLTGWKYVKANEAEPEVTVTEGEELCVRGGPVELQTERLWSDFILQLEARTDGEGGGAVLFRGMPDRPESGYQIPICHSGPGGNSVGGITGLQPPRKAIAPADGWLALTVVARGNHLAAWVNGYQTANFTDTRAPAQDAGKGSRIGKGPITLRARDMFFRKVRLAELRPGPDLGNR